MEIFDTLSSVNEVQELTSESRHFFDFRTFSSWFLGIAVVNRLREDVALLTQGRGAVPQFEQCHTELHEEISPSCTVTMFLEPPAR